MFYMARRLLEQVRPHAVDPLTEPDAARIAVIDEERRPLRMDRFYLRDDMDVGAVATDKQWDE